MKRAELLAAIAAVLPIGAVAMIPEPEPEPIVHVDAEPGRPTRWRVVHPSREGRLLSYHELDEPCDICKKYGVPGGLL